MGIDSSIALGVRPVQVPDRMNMLAQVLQIKGAQQAQELHAMQADQVRRGLAADTALNEAYKGALGPDGLPDRNKLFQTLAGQGYGSKIPGLQKQFIETDKAQAELRSKAAEGYKLFQNTLGSQFNNPNLSKESVLQTVKGLVDANAFDGNVAARLVQSLPEDPQQLRVHLQQVLKSQMTPEQMLTVFAPKAEKIDNGQQISFRDTNPNSPTYGQVTAGAAVQKVADPGAVLSSQTAIENNKRSVAAQYANAQATRDAAATQAQATRAAAEIKDKRDTEMKLADDWRNQSKNFREASDAYKQLDATLDKAATSPAATLAAATKFMKQIDPGSVVRESELGMALAATGALDRAANYFNTLQRGKVLTPQQVKDFKNIAGQIYQAAQQTQVQIDKNYRQQAQTYGLRPDMVVQDLGQGGGAPATNPQVDQLVNKYLNQGK